MAVAVIALIGLEALHWRTTKSSGVSDNPSRRLHGRTRGLRLSQVQPFYTTRVGLQDLKFETGWVAYDFAPLGQAPKQGDHKAAERIHLLIFFRGLQIDSSLLAKILQIHSRIGFPPTIRKRAQLRSLSHVMFIVNVTYDLFDEIFNRDESVSAAVFIDHQRQVHVTRLHLEQ
jgi:hypothetical protein